MEDNQHLSERLLDLTKKRKYTQEDFQKAKAYLEAGADPNSKVGLDYAEETPLAKALNCWNEQQKFEMVKLLVDFDADVNQNFDIFYPIQKAVIRGKGDLKLIQFLLANGATAGLDQALKVAIEKDFIEVAKLLLATGIDVSIFKPHNESFLNFCTEPYRCRKEDKEYEVLPGLKMAQLLIDAGADPSGIKNARSNPIQAAIAVDFVELAELLLKNGAKPETQDEESYPVLTQVNSVEMAKCLLRYGASLTKRQQNGFTPLMAATMHKRKKLISFFIDQGVDIYEIDENKNTGFHTALYNEDAKFVEFIVPYYDVKKCHKIRSVLDITDNPKINNVLRQHLGLEEEIIPEKIDYLLSQKTDPVFIKLSNQAKTLEQQLQEKSPSLMDYIPDYQYALDPSNIDYILDQLKENLNQWKDELKNPIQALYLEFNGDTVDPYDACALFWGFGTCTDSLEFSNPVLNESGDVDLNIFFEDMESLLENFEPYYDDIKLFLSTLSFISLHVAFHQLINSKDFDTIYYKSPFYLIGCEHDQHKTVIYKK